MKKRKIKISKLSTKIILALVIIIGTLSLLIPLFYLISDYFEILDFEGRQHMRPWAFGFPISFGLIIGILFAYYLRRTLIIRIERLRKATESVAKGNFANHVEDNGEDELSELADSFNKMTRELEANAYLSKDFVRNISHEYKTPLAVIKSYSELIQSEVSNNSQESKDVINEYTDIIIAEVDRMSHMSQDVLALSLLDSTTIVKKEDEFSPAEQIREILRKTNFIWGAKDITFNLVLDEDRFTSNKMLLYQVWENLINNAIKFSYTGSEILIKLTINNKLTFSVTDYGEGVKDEDVAKLFDHFYVGDKARNLKGSGLGLAIVKAITTKLEGTVTYTKGEQKGSVFTVEL